MLHNLLLAIQLANQQLAIHFTNKLYNDLDLFVKINSYQLVLIYLV